MSPWYNLAWAVILLPLIGALSSLLFETPRRAAQSVIACNALGLVSSLFLLVFRIANRRQGPSDGVFGFVITDPQAGPGTGVFPANLQPQLGLRVDNFSVAFAAVILFVGVVVMWHATSSLRNDGGYRRLFWSGSLLVFGGVGLAMSPNLFQALFMMMITTTASYILATHWWETDSIASAARRGFAWLLAGDVALFLAVVVTYLRLGTAISALPLPTGATINDPFDFNLLRTEVQQVAAHTVPGIGPKTLAVIGILIVIAALIRCAVVPAVAWLTAMGEAPVLAIAFNVSVVAGGGVILLAKTWPMLLAVPHLLSIVAIIGVVSAVICAVVALMLRDIAHLCGWLSAAQLGLVVAALGVGGYAPGLQMLVVFMLLTPALVLICSNLVRGYRTRDITEMGGAWSRMRTSATCLGVWWLAVAGLNFASYSVVSAAWRNVFADQLHVGANGHVAQSIRLIVIVGAALGSFIIAVAGARLWVRVCAGAPVQRRGFVIERLREADSRVVRSAIFLLLAAFITVAVSVPANVTGFTFSHFVFFGQPPEWPQSLPIVGPAIAIAIAVGVAAAATGFALARLQVSWDGLPARWARAQLGFDTAAAWVMGGVTYHLGTILHSTDREVVDGLTDAGGEAIVLVATEAERARTPRVSRQLTAAVVMMAFVVGIAAITAARVGAH